MRTPLLAVFFLGFSALAFSFAETFRVTDRTKVYLGTADAFSTPAVLDASKVMEVLPAMKTIKEDGIKKDSARWFMLMNEASQQFQKVVKAVAKDGNYDLIAEIGAVTGPKAIVDVTDSSIAAAQKN